MHILFVEDEAKIANFVRAGLKEQGFVVDYCDNGDEGYSRALDNEYDALVLDIMVPGKDGLSILKNLRRKGQNVPVILLTARNELDDRLEGLNLGADDYLAKPFFVEELVARIHAVVRRSAGDRQNLVCVGPIKLDLRFALLASLSHHARSHLQSAYCRTHDPRVQSPGISDAICASLFSLRYRLDESSPERKFWNTSGAMISIPIPTW